MHSVMTTHNMTGEQSADRPGSGCYRAVLPPALHAVLGTVI